MLTHDFFPYIDVKILCCILHTGPWFSISLLKEITWSCSRNGRECWFDLIFRWVRIERFPRFQGVGAWRFTLFFEPLEIHIFYFVFQPTISVFGYYWPKCHPTWKAYWNSIWKRTHFSLRCLISQCYCWAISSVFCRVFWNEKTASHWNIAASFSIRLVSYDEWSYSSCKEKNPIKNHLDNVFHKYQMKKINWREKLTNIFFRIFWFARTVT